MLEDFLRDHDGVITLAQAEEAGLSRQAVYRRVQSGRWLRCSRGVYFADDRPFTDAARTRAAVWSLGSNATASGLAAAWWLGVTRYAPEIIEVTVPKVSNFRQRHAVKLRRRDLDPRDVVERRGLRVTALPLTVVEAAAGRGGGAKLMDTALQRHTELRELWRAHVRNKGRHGSPAARILLIAAADGARSAAERLLIKLLKEAGITGWKANYRLGRYVIDVAFPAATLAIETDGWAFHSDQEDFQKDRVKQNEIALMGWQVLRFTWLDLTEYPQRVIAEIRFAIECRSTAAASFRTGAAR
ncbi:type IV toxin-antitoxin system AbiEi family antitoxin domain-containing protein [Mycolicibacterium sp. 050232]|uniref:type IV toxin-antitoxin system AbiEi family antitoxin domain-containing protein n=1 Tax=Mycolicibacterium sp. 050232 TaxID=3113982 RepID=UPI002E27FA9C|nr:type IV toxin-antitoxin system AbiEi family antitoxin domain-containing protein [Mycolicibacterium sp. 050232]MED5810811.1 type IV toxin-antitoxin system AbiEi family antitoxin domain-containing protein [Mycolicibacterium sp. 050232]